MQHIKATAVGKKVVCNATIIFQEGRKYRFDIIATDENGEIIGKCIHERMIVNIEKFMSKL